MTIKLIEDKKYNFKNQKERLIYLGCNWSGNGFWHQFALVESPTEVWSEMLDSDLHMIEETKEIHNSRKPCNNCNSTTWAAWNETYCTDCEHNYTQAYIKAQWISINTKYLYSLDGDDVIVFKDNRWSSERDTPAHWIRTSSMYKAI